MLALLLTTGCYSQTDFADDVATATCDWYDRCDLLAVMTYDDVDTCLAALSPPDTGYSCLAYSNADAKTCVADLESAGCEDPVPESCSLVCAEPVVDTGDSATE